MSENDEEIDFTKLQPWNSSDYPIKVNSIRYNQDCSLLTLGTSKGYRIFFVSSLRNAHEPSEAVTNLGDINIAMTYYKSSLIFLLPSRNNPNYSNYEIIVFDDLYQDKFASFKDKSEEILNFFLSKNTIFVITLSKIIVLEIFSFKIIEIINNINSINQLLSYNYFDFIAYTELKEKTKIIIKYYLNEKHKAVSLSKNIVKISFDYMQTIQLSPSGLVIGVVSIFGNKIHIYFTKTGKLKECILLSPYMLTVEKLLFSKKENYILILKGDKKFNVYKLNNLQNYNNIKCLCSKYKDNNIMLENMEEKKTGFFGFFRRASRNTDLKETHAFSETKDELSFIDFDGNKNKDVIIINKKGEFFKYHFKKKACGHLTPILSFQWE
jgi:hypothetical protein